MASTDDTPTRRIDDPSQPPTGDTPTSHVDHPDYHATARYEPVVTSSHQQAWTDNPPAQPTQTWHHAQPAPGAANSTWQANTIEPEQTAPDRHSGAQESPAGDVSRWRTATFAAIALALLMLIALICALLLRSSPDDSAAPVRPEMTTTTVTDIQTMQAEPRTATRTETATDTTTATSTATRTRTTTQRETVTQTTTSTATVTVTSAPASTPASQE